ncbi:RxLR effector protein [Phytophthora megakarya]|uniref:RxLR effector protein n=1 Tax=Phytophthora megakarya TaxID=4795 RepID=A0A225VWN8_9STRA|nr:RxLR effector protein [Phytophthora megakarya]
MTSIRRVGCPTYFAVLIVMLFLVYSVTAQLEAKEVATIPRLAQSADMGENAVATVRFLRGGGSNGGVSPEVGRNEERGILPSMFKFKTPSYYLTKWTLKLKLHDINDVPTPGNVFLEDFIRLRVPLREDYLLLWMSYALKYMKKEVRQWPEDNATYIPKFWKEYVPDEQIPALFVAMQKRPQMRAFAIQLQQKLEYYARTKPNWKPTRLYWLLVGSVILNSIWCCISVLSVDIQNSLLQYTCYTYM